MKTFALIGAAGYIAPRHLQAIKDTGGDLVAALDPHDSVGILDKYFPECSFFTEFERFDRHCEKLKREGKGIDYVSICSPNYLHDAHAIFALRIGADAICEKPIILNERNLDAMEEMEKETGHKIYALYQLRLHPEVLRMKKMVEDRPNDFFRINVEYHTPRGQWYGYSWKADFTKSGGTETNIGCHLFDVVSFVFGKAKRIDKGNILLERGYCDYSISTSECEPRRIFTVNNEAFDLSNGFTELHTKMYQEILAGRGVGIEDVRESVRICEAIRE